MNSVAGIKIGDDAHVGEEEAAAWPFLWSLGINKGLERAPWLAGSGLFPLWNRRKGAAPQPHPKFSFQRNPNPPRERAQHLWLPWQPWRR